VGRPVDGPRQTGSGIVSSDPASGVSSSGWRSEHDCMRETIGPIVIGYRPWDSVARSRGLIVRLGNIFISIRAAGTPPDPGQSDQTLRTHVLV